MYAGLETWQGCQVSEDDGWEWLKLRDCHAQGVTPCRCKYTYVHTLQQGCKVVNHGTCQNIFFILPTCLLSVPRECQNIFLACLRSVPRECRAKLILEGGVVLSMIATHKPAECCNLCLDLFAYKDPPDRTKNVPPPGHDTSCHGYLRVCSVCLAKTVRYRHANV